ncbi:MAG TPA: hypothetical protein VKU42_09835 [Candidatus Angelobacter sp.]|nr:hypothetical protein [Candidatus Angelobacter sp.]
MNRLRILLIGAALITGGSALASAQTLQTEVAYHDQYRDRYHDDRRFDNRYRDQKVYRDSRFDHDRRYETGYRRWDGRRWQRWDGRRWVY